MDAQEESARQKILDEVDANAAYAMQQGYGYSEGPIGARNWTPPAKPNPWVPVVAAGELLLFIGFVIWVLASR